MLRLAALVGILSAVIGIVALQAGLLTITAPATVLSDQNGKAEMNRLSGSSVPGEEPDGQGVETAGSSSDDRSSEEPAVHPSGDERQGYEESSSSDTQHDREESGADTREEDAASQEQSGACDGDTCDRSSAAENEDASSRTQEEASSEAANERQTEDEREPPPSCGNGRCERFGCDGDRCFFDFETCGICPEDCGSCPAAASSASSSSTFDACTSCDDCRGREGIGCNPQECFQWGKPGACLFNWAGRVVDGITVSCVPVAACSASSAARSVSTSSSFFSSASRSFSARSESASRSRASSAVSSVSSWSSISSRSSATSSSVKVSEKETPQSSAESVPEIVRDCSACNRCNGAESCTAATCMRNDACFFLLRPDGKGECSPGASCTADAEADLHEAPPAGSDDQRDFCCARDSDSCAAFSGVCNGTVFYASNWASDQCSSVCSALNVHLYLCMGTGICEETTSLDNIRAGQVVFGNRGKCNQFCLTGGR